MNFTYITGNPEKAKRFNDRLTQDIAIADVDIPEIQSLDIAKVVEHKAKAAYEIVGSPVIVEDTALTFHALGQLPGPLVKLFLQSLSMQQLADLAPKENRGATVDVMFGVYDGTDLYTVAAQNNGTIASTPRGDGGYGWDQLFIPDGFPVTQAEMETSVYEDHYQTRMKPFAALQTLLDSLS